MSEVVKMRISLLAIAILAALPWMLGPSSAVAQERDDDERARGHFLAGRSYYEQGSYEDAAEQFMESYELSGRAVLLLNVASAHERALHFDEAVAALEAYLQRVPDSDDRETIEQRIARVRELGRRHRAGVEEQEPDSPVEDGPDAAQTTAGGLGPLGITGLSLGALGVVAGVVTIVTGVLALDQYATLDAACGVDGHSCPAGSQAQIESGSTLALTSTVFLPISLAALAAGTVLLALDLAGGQSEAGEASAHLVVGPGDAGVGVRVRF